MEFTTDRSSNISLLVRSQTHVDMFEAPMSDTLSAIVTRPNSRKTSPMLVVGVAADDPVAPAARLPLAGVDRVDVGRGESRSFAQRRVDAAEIVAMTLADPRMSTSHARITRVGGAWVIEDLGSKNGTWIDGTRIERRPLKDDDAILVGHTMLVYRERGGELGGLDGAPPECLPGLATLSALLEERFRELASAAASNIPIEIRGETGTGKELVARAVHAASGRPGRFVPVNCGAIPSTMVEAELFGHKKGAFTGATEDRLGLVRSADRGTLFLDEVAELPAASQAGLLRVLQEHEVTPVGSDRTHRVDLRVVTATHRDLDADASTERFRADLRARLLGFAITLPPLRERREDLGLIVAALLRRHAGGREVAFSADAAAALYTHAWPLNIRELERALAAALAIAGDRIELQHLPSLADRDPAPAPREPSPEDRPLRDELVAALGRHDGNVAAVARELGKDPTQIRRWMKRFGLQRE